MTVTQQLMGYGSWTLQLDDTATPAAVWNALNPSSGGFGHILIMPVEVSTPSYSDATLKSLARYTGIYRGTASRNTLTGTGLAAWLGDEDGKGNLHESIVDGTDPTSTYSAKTFRAWVMDALNVTAGGLGPITAGTLTSIAGTFTSVVQPPASPLSVLDAVMDYYGGEWRINPNGTLDAGTEADLFVTSPTAAAIWNGGGRDASLKGLRGVDVDVARDLEDYSTRVVMVGQNGATGAANISPATSFKDLHGNTAVWVRAVDAPQAGAGNLSSLASAQLGRFNGVRNGYTLSTIDWDVAGTVKVGDSIWVYDPRPDAKLRDTTNQVQFRGQTIYPIKLRVKSMTWPVQQGMGVLFRAPDGTYTDLTPYIVWETGAATLDVGASPRRATGSTRAQADIEQRLSGPRGTIGYAQVTTSQTGITSEVDLTGLSVTVTAGTNRRLRITGYVRCQAASGTSRASVRIKEGATQLVACPGPLAVASSEEFVATPAVIVSASAGSHTYKLTGQQTSGTGTMSANCSSTSPNYIMVEDLGPIP